MHLQLALDSPGPYTNLDVITGRVLLSINSNTTISHITVKLEGQSRTRLLVPPRPGTNERPRPSLEIHKLLYKIAKVFPPDNIAQAGPGGPSTNYILNPGQYSYPFSFKIPFNNACMQNNTVSTNLNFAGMALEVAKTPTQHVKTTLPPSIYFPGEAEIRYYLKVTVNLPSFLKQNPRAFSNLTFVPIEPPRSPSDGETYARRQHQFIHDNFPLDRKGSSTGAALFGKLGRKNSSTPNSPMSSSQATLAPARFSIDARLPNPAVLTCGENVPLRLLVKQLSERSEQLYLQTLQVELIGHTNVRAHDAVRTETNGWVLVSMSNINQPLGNANEDAGTETEISKEFWYGQKLPDSVPPSFVTCNISRKYELKVSAGLAFGAMNGRNQFIVLPLHINVEVFSGIRPPPELLKRLHDAPPNKPVMSGSYSSHPLHSGSMQPSAGPSSGPPGQNAPPGYEEAPPSYDEAISQDLPPVTSARPAYRPPPAPEGESRITDEKRG